MIRKRVLAVLVSSLFFFGSSALADGPKGDSIVDVAIDLNTSGAFAEQFDILIAAVLNADPSIYDALTGNGKLTVFAPTDTAFEDSLGEDEATIIGLIESGAFPQDVLTDILAYHVAHGNRMANSVVRSKRIRMLFGGFTYPNGATLTDNLDRTADIIATDVKAANGVIHAISLVVLPYNPF